MKILVYGAGAIGSAIGERLSKAHEVTLMTRRPHAEAIGANGLLVCDNQDGAAFVYLALLLWMTWKRKMWS